MLIGDEFSFLTLIAFSLVILTAGLVHGTLGLGFPLVATPLLALGVDVRTAILVTLLPTIAVNIISIVYGGGWRYSIGRYWPLAAYAVVGSAVGTYILIVNDPRPFKLLLAALTLLYLGATGFRQLRISLVSEWPRLSKLLFGLSAGFAAGTTNVMVPILIIYSLEVGLAKTAMVQVFNLCFFAGKIAQIGVFSQAGAFSYGFVGSVMPLVGVAIAGVLIGTRLRNRIPTETYRRIVRRVLFVIAILLVGQFAMSALSAD